VARGEPSAGTGIIASAPGFAYALYRSNKGATGVDGQDFADIEAYGLERWLGELALALRDEVAPTSAVAAVTVLCSSR
jgi:hypothetical protein